jgi:hypothetical protein
MSYVKLNHDFAKFIDTAFYAEIIQKDDDAVSVLRLQLLCERFLNVYLEERIPTDQRDFFVSGRGKKAELLKYFNEKIRTAVALGLPVELAKSLKHLNGMRNEFAHSFDAKLEQKEVEQYFELVDKFVVKTDQAHGFEGPVSQAEAVSDGKKVKANESPKIGLTIATYFLMTKAGLWLVNDLQRRGQLKIG